MSIKTQRVLEIYSWGEWIFLANESEDTKSIVEEIEFAQLSRLILNLRVTFPFAHTIDL